MVESLKDQPFALVGVNSDAEDRDVLAKKFAESNIRWRNGLLGSAHAETAIAWGVRVWPTLVVVDEDGRLVWRGHDHDTAVAKVRDLLGLSK